MSSHRPRFERYAVYFSPPPETPIQQFAGHWFGCDTFTGERRSPLRLKGFSAEDLTAITAQPAHYGFHATLKAPFRLSAEASCDDLLRSLSLLASTLEPVVPLRLKLGELSGFLALRPNRDENPIGAIADACTTQLDRFRAALCEQERSQRLNSPLTKRQMQLLDRWGYPYVLSEFRFHMTLSTRLDEPLRSRLFDALAPPVAVALAEPFNLDSLCLFGDPGGGAPFQFLHRIRFSVPAPTERQPHDPKKPV